MDKKPLVMVAKEAKDAAKKLNEYVENGAFAFDFGIIPEYSVTVTKHSDGSTSEEKERRYRFTGFYQTYQGEELDSWNKVKEDLEKTKKERAELNRTLDIINKSPFAPISILLLGIAVFTLIFGILTIAGVLPLPKSQIGIAIALVIVGVLALGGSIALAILRNNKKKMLIEHKDEYYQQDQELKEKEQEINSRIPDWYKKAFWTAEGNVIKNSSQTHTLK